MSTVSERATQARRAQRPMPSFLARAQGGNGWVSIGAAWPFRSGEPGLSVQLQTVPVGAWDGRFVLLEPLPNGEAGEPPAEEPAPQATPSGGSGRRRRGEAKPDDEIPF